MKNLTELDYNIIATGSTGNAVRIESVMFDCGIAFNKMKADLYKVDTLLITHAHSDHIKPSTLERIRKEFPSITICANADVAYRYDVDIVVGGKPFKLRKHRTVIPFEGIHDVPVTVFLESNFDERKLKEQAKRYRRHGYDPYLSVTRHLSTQKCKEFYFVHRRNEDSKLIELHQSHRFY